MSQSNTPGLGLINDEIRTTEPSLTGYERLRPCARFAPFPLAGRLDSSGMRLHPNNS